MDVSSNLQKDRPQIVCVLGGPGSGKGTQCEKLVRDLKFKHLSVGDLMRAEIEKKTKEGQECEKHVKNGELVPTNLTINILLKALNNGGSKRYLLDGFPRSLDQALYFENNYREIDFILNYDLPDETLERRILARAAETKGEKRADDNPEIIKKRLATFHEQTDKVLKFYRQFGKVRDVNAEKGPDDVYKATRAALQPNLIFFYGPPASGQVKVAEHLADLTGYRYLETAQFYTEKGISDASDEIKMDALANYIDTHPERNFVLNHFPESIKQTKIFCENFCEPKIFYYFDTSRDQVESNIYHENKRHRLKKLEDYDKFTKSRKEILAYFRAKSYFVTISGNETPEHLWDQVRTNITPQIIVLPVQPKAEFNQKFVEQLKTKRGYEVINVNSLINDEGLRGTDVAKDIAKANQSHDHISDAKVKLLRRVLFKDILRKKFILSGYPETVQHFNHFQKHCCKISYGLAFEGEIPKQNSENLLATLNGRGKLIKIRNQDFLDVFDNFLENKCAWGFVIGPNIVTGENTTIVTPVSKYLNGRMGKLINWTTLDEELKKLFATEDGEPESISFAQYCKYFKDQFKKLSRTDAIIFDSLPAENPDFTLAKFVAELGAPSFVINVTANKDLQIKRARVEAGVPDEEPETPPELIENVTNIFNAWNDQVKVFDDLKEGGASFNRWDIDGYLLQPEMIRRLNTIIYKKVFVFNSNDNRFTNYHFKTYLQNYCLHNKVTFVDVPELINEQLHGNGALSTQLKTQLEMRSHTHHPNNPSHYTPDLVIGVIKAYLNSHPSQKYVFIYGYPSADGQENDFYPKSLDELYNIEIGIGPVRWMCTPATENENYQIIDDIEPKVVKEAPKKVVSPDGDEAADEVPQNNEAQPPAEEEEEGKKKFDPTIFEWTTSNGRPKKLTQIFHKVNCNHNVTYGAKNYQQVLDSALQEAMGQFEEDAPGNIYFELLVE